KFSFWLITDPCYSENSIIRKKLLHRHLIFCQCSRLIGTNNGCTSQSLHRRKFSDKRIALYHTLYAQSQYDCYHGGQSFGNGGYGKTYSSQKNILYLASTQPFKKKNQSYQNKTNAHYPF